MAYNGSGVFNRLYSWVTDKANGVKVNATRMDAEMDGMATGLSTCITKDGQTTITANIPFANNKITGLGAGTATTDAATLAQVQSQASSAATVGGTADAITLTTSPTIAAYAANQRVRFVATGTNTGAVTVARDGLAARAVQANGAALVAGDIVSGNPYELIDNGTNLQLFSSKAAVIHTADLAADAKTGAVRAVVGTTDTILAADRGKLVTYSNAASIAVTIPQATGSFTTPFKFSFVNLGAGTVTFTPTTSTINGAATLTAATGDGGEIFSDGTNYFGQLGNAQETVTLPLGYLAGLTISNNGTDANNDLDIAAGEARDATDAVDMALASALTKRMDANWAVGTNQGGLDTGSEASGTWYYVWLIKRSDTGVVDVLLSASASAPTMPANYDYKRLIGAIRNDGSSNILAFKQRNTSRLRKFMFNTPIIDVDDDNPGTAAVTRTLTVPPLGVNCRVQVGVFVDTGVANAAYVSALDQVDLAPQPANTAVLATPATVAANFTNWIWGYAEVDADTSSQIRSRLAATSASTRLGIVTLGWEYEF